MASNAETTPDAEASKWFKLAIIGTLLYVGAVFAFVLTAPVGYEAEAADAQEHNEVHEHGQPD
ncbi:MAG: hypothetical protein OEZ06_18820 [Myxococcales bacterium]|nr:hypothetical protein [Myxococcales bacterium]